jgi:hypothetical protein
MILPSCWHEEANVNCRIREFFHFPPTLCQNQAQEFTLRGYYIWGLFPAHYLGIQWPLQKNAVLRIIGSRKPIPGENVKSVRIHGMTRLCLLSFTYL